MKKRFFAAFLGMVFAFSSIALSPAALADDGLFSSDASIVSAAAPNDIGAVSNSVGTFDYSVPLVINADGKFETGFMNNTVGPVSQDINFILAVYENTTGKLAYVEPSFFSGSIGAYKFQSHTFTASASAYPSSQYTVKAFRWDGDYIPLPEVKLTNVALKRAAYQSSAVDEFATATLVTDGIVSEPVEKSFTDGPWVAQTRYYKEWVYVDLGEATFVETVATTWGETYANRFHIQSSDDGVNWSERQAIGSNLYSGESTGIGSGNATTGASAVGRPVAPWANGTQIQDLAVTNSYNPPYSAPTASNEVGNPADRRFTARYVRILCDSCSGVDGTYILKGISINGTAVDTYYASSGFDSYWATRGNADDQWTYIDLGADTLVTGVKIAWGGNYAANYTVQKSSDAKSWVDVATGNGASNTTTKVEFDGVTARYIRVCLYDQINALNEPGVDSPILFINNPLTFGSTITSGSYIIKEIEVNGIKAFDYTLPDLPAPEADGTQYLTGGNWKLERATEVDADGVQLSSAGYDDSSWLPAAVPATTLVSYLKAGAIPEPYYDLQNMDISDTYFTTDFWYRDSFTVPADKQGKDVFLNFDAINYRADVYFNGQFLPNALAGSEQYTLTDHARSIEGGFIRGKFDVTDLVNYGGENYVAVFIQMNDTTWGYSGTGAVGNNGASSTIGNIIIRYTTQQYLNAGPWTNGGNIGIDNPTFHAALGWDWAPTIRGRDTGIYRDVYVSYSDGVRLLDPWIETDLDIVEVPNPITAMPIEIPEGTQVTQPSGQNSQGILDSTVGGDNPSGIPDNKGLSYLLDNDATTSWVGDKSAENPSFTIDLGSIVNNINTIVINWGELLPNNAYESQNAARFKIEASTDGTTWRNFDSYPAGGSGVNVYPAFNGTDYYVGGNISNIIQGPTNPTSSAAITSEVRYLRFTTLEKLLSKQSDQGIVPPKIQDILLYSETRAALDTSGEFKYTLDDSKANLTFRTEVKNSKDTDQSAMISGVITPSGLTFSKTVNVPANTTIDVDITDIIMQNPDLWWPNTYGDQPLYTASVTLKLGNVVSDTKEFKFGVREFTYPRNNANRLAIYCNGTRILLKGGNWGMDDAMVRDTPERYDDKVRLHAEENMTMIRLWVGQSNSTALYDAADKYGILIWDDFWLANPADGPNPKDRNLFRDNALDKVKTYRSRASLCVYCGRNESNPSADLAEYLRVITEQYDGTRYYFNNSSALPVGSGGGYSIANYEGTGNNQGMKYYFTNVSSEVIRSERGIPNVPSIQSIRKMVAPENQWPISASWAQHDWTYMMNGPCNTFMNAFKSYLPKITWTFPGSPGGSQNQDPESPTMIAYRDTFMPLLDQLADWYTLDEFAEAAQMINFENHRGMFQALTTRRAGGLLMWMSQSAWPSFMWQTYDWYLDTNAGYFGVKAGNQPTQAVMDPRDNSFMLSNFTRNTYKNVKTEITVYNLNGEVEYSAVYDTPELGPDAYGINLATITNEQLAEYSSTELVFIRTVVKDETGAVLGENIYWHNPVTYLNHKSLSTLSDVALTASKSEAVTLANGNTQYTLTLKNDTSIPAVQTRIRTISLVTGEDVLPTFYSDNYFTLMPGDTKVVTAEFNPKYLEGGSLKFELSGWNTTVKEISETAAAEDVKMVNDNSTPETKSLFAYLKNQSGSIMFGHDETGLISGSDVVRAVNDRPSVLTTNVRASVAGIRDAYARGQLISAEHHIGIAAGFGSSYGNTTTGDMAWGHRLVPGQAYHANLVNYLKNTVAPWARSLTVSDTDPTLIPIIYRPWHEHNGDWFWWNTPNTTEGEMIEIFRFTVEYLRDVEGITNFIYAFSPNGHFDSEEEYLYAYPGDEYIDLMGIDIYWDVPESNPDWFDLMIKDCRIAMNYANKTGKPAALTECGLRWDTKDGFEPLGTHEGNGKTKEEAGLQTKKLSEEQRTWYTTMADRILNDDLANQIAYMAVWRQGTDSSNLHFWVPFKDFTAGNTILPVENRGYLGDHQALGDFVEYYNRDGVKFLSDTADDPKFKLDVSATQNAPYVSIKAPVKDEVLIANPPAPNPAYVIPSGNPRPSDPAAGKYRVLVYPALLTSDESVVSVKVDFAGQSLTAVKGTDLAGNTDSDKPKYYYADIDITSDAVADGRYDISATVTTSADKVLTYKHSVKVKNQASAAQDAYVIDDFDSYDPTDDNRTDLERVWFRDSGCMVGLRLREAGKGDAVGFGTGNVLRLKYDTCRKGASSTGTITPHTNNIYWSGFYKNYSTAVNWSEATKLSLVVQSDGKPHNLAFIITAGGKTYQAYANDSEIPYDRSLTTPQNLLIDISKFKLMNTSGFGVSITQDDLQSVTRFSVRMESDPGQNFAGLNAKEFYLFDDIRWITQ